jgi:hypothetical protein
MPTADPSVMLFGRFLGLATAFDIGIILRRARIVSMSSLWWLWSIWWFWSIGEPDFLRGRVEPTYAVYYLLELIYRRSASDIPVDRRARRELWRGRPRNSL